MYTTLISVAQLQALQSSGAPLQVFDCSFDLAQPEAGRAMFAQSHIAGAVYADLNTDLSITTLVVNLIVKKDTLQVFRCYSNSTIDWFSSLKEEASLCNGINRCCKYQGFICEWKLFLLSHVQSWDPHMRFFSGSTKSEVTLNTWNPTSQKLLNFRPGLYKQVVFSGQT